MSFNRNFNRHKRKEEKAKAAAAILQMPKPEVIAGKCQCGCCHVPAIGACPQFIPGGNSRCAVCDHSILCHRRKGEPPPKDWDSPVVISDRMRRVIPPRRLAELQGTTCPFCKARTILCATCGATVPIKEVIDVFHTGRCPQCGAIDANCPGPHSDR